MNGTKKSLDKLHGMLIKIVEEIIKKKPHSCDDGSNREKRRGGNGHLPKSKSTAKVMERERLFRMSPCDNPPRKIPYYCLRPIHFGH
jgi:hypothetical protein